MRILAVGAHPDDVELGCFGTLLELQKQGHTVHAVSLTSGRAWKRPWAERKKCLDASAAILRKGGDAAFHAGAFIEGHLEHGKETVAFVDDLIRDLQIDTILTHHYGESHQDHIAAERIAASASRKSVRTLLLWESVLYTHRNVFPFRPQLYVPISPAAFRGKGLALRNYARKGFLQPTEALAHQHLARYRGGEVGARYAEAFEVVWQTLTPTPPAPPVAGRRRGA